MIIRQAFFEGSILSGKEDAFRDYVSQKLMPMWSAFPGIKEVRVLYELEHDEGAPSYSMVLSTTYESRDALAAALNSPIRFESREMTKALLQMFNGHVHHHVFEIADSSVHQSGSDNCPIDGV
jgi:hypothetical protein